MITRLMPRLGPLAILLFSVTALAQDLGPEALVKKTAGEVVQQIDAHHDEYQQDPNQLHALIRKDLLPVLDMPYAARLILGRAGRDATPKQLDEFTDAMSNLLIKRYATGLLDYRSEDRLQILPVKGDLNDRMTRVQTRVRLNSGKFAPVDYIFHKTANGWKAFDVIVEGISYVTTYRNQIVPEVQQSGLDAVIARLNSGDIQLQD